MLRESSPSTTELSIVWASRPERIRSLSQALAVLAGSRVGAPQGALVQQALRVAQQARAAQPLARAAQPLELGEAAAVQPAGLEDSRAPCWTRLRSSTPWRASAS